MCVVWTIIAWIIANSISVQQKQDINPQNLRQVPSSESTSPVATTRPRIKFNFSVGCRREIHQWRPSVDPLLLPFSASATATSPPPATKTTKSPSCGLITIQTPPPSPTTHQSHSSYSPGAAVPRASLAAAPRRSASTRPRSPTSSSLPLSAFPILPPAASPITTTTILILLMVMWRWGSRVACSTRHCWWMGRCGFGGKETAAASGLATRIPFLSPL